MVMFAIKERKKFMKTLFRSIWKLMFIWTIILFLTVIGSYACAYNIYLLEEIFLPLYFISPNIFDITCILSLLSIILGIVNVFRKDIKPVFSIIIIITYILFVMWYFCNM